MLIVVCEIGIFIDILYKDFSEVDKICVLYGFK